MKKATIGLVGLLVIGLCATLAIGQVPKEVLVVGARTDIIVDLDPARAYEVFTDLVLEQYYDTLVDFEGGPTAFEKIEPGLAESWEVSDDGLTWIFHLRKGAKFHGGDEVTADAVVFSFHRSLELDFAPIWILSQYVPEKDMVRKVDDYTVTITTTEPVAEFIIASIVGFQGICSIVDPSVVEAHKTADDPWANAWLKEHDAGSGPFILREWSPNERVALDRFDDYWEGPAKVKRLIFKDIPEPATQKLALEKGDIDIAWDLLPEQVDALRGTPGFELVEVPSWGIEYLSVNAGKPPFDKEEVRDAIRWAIDYDAIIYGIQKGAAVPGQTFIPTGMFGHLDEVPYHKDVERAKNLLVAAGYPDGFEVELLSSTHPRRVAIATQVQADLAEIGVTAHISQMVSAQFYELYRGQAHEMLVAGWGVDYADPDAVAKPFAHCCTTGPEASVRQLAWRNMYADCDTTLMVEGAAKELDSEKRKEMYCGIQRRILDKGPFAIFYYPLFRVVTTDNVKGVELAPMRSYTEFYGIYKEQ